jgi:iron complex outermembrane receptor protein
MYIDGVAQFQSYNYPIHLGNVESVEVLKGPQITLYGRNALAGIIDIKTKVPPNRFSISTSGEWFSGRNLKFGGHTYVLATSFPMVRNKAYLKLGGFYNKKIGSFYNAIINKPTGGAEVYNVYLRSDFFFPFWEFYFQTKFERVRENPFPYNNNKEEAFRTPFFVYHNRNNFSQKDIIDNVLNFKIILKYFDISSVWSYQYFLGKLDIDTDFSISKSFLKLNFKQHVFTGENKMTSTEDSSRYFSWTAGNYFYFQKRDILSDSEFNIGISQNTYLNIKEVNLGFALFGNITYPILENFHFIVGFRGDYDYKKANIDKKITDLISSVIKKIPNRLEEKHYYIFSPKIAINYYFDKLNLAYFSFSRGFRVGGINTFTSRIDKLLYKPEDNWNLELGFKSSFVPSYKGSIVVNVFYIYWNNPQINVFLSRADSIFDFGIINANKSQSIGVELEAELPIIWGFKTGGTYGFSKSTFINFIGTDGKQLKGKLQPYIPQHMLLAYLQHKLDFELLSNKDAFINRFDFKYISKIYYNPQNTQEQLGYYLLSYTMNVRINGIIATFWIKNLLDNRYLDFALPFGLRLTPKLGEARTFGGKISFIF